MKYPYIWCAAISAVNRHTRNSVMTVVPFQCDSKEERIAEQDAMIIAHEQFPPNKYNNHNVIVEMVEPEWIKEAAQYL